MGKRRKQQPPAAMPGVPLDGAPVYVKIVVWLLMWFGLPMMMVIAFFFVFIGYLPSPVTETASNMRDHRRETGEILKYMETNAKIARQICRNTSPDPADRVACNQ